MFLCRDAELKKLENRYNHSSPECIVIYGRRRVGKTALINEFVKEKPTIYFPALKANAQDNLAAFSKAIYSYHFPNVDASAAPVYPSFDTAFSAVTNILTSSEGRVVFVIDELPYLVNADPSIPSRLQHLLDHDWSDTKLFLILCGSSMSFMEEHVLGEKSPLFGRRTAQFKIEPLNYRDTAAFHPELSAEENALIYGITGGVPHYINKLNARGSIQDALKENFFDPSAYLFEEPENLLKQELREPAVYNSIITAIAEGSSRLSEIASKVGLETSAVSKYLSTLISLHIVQKIEPVLNSNKRKAIYRITDPFFRFWYRFVPGNMASISSGNIDRVYQNAIESYLPEYMGLVFEDICRQYLTQYASTPFPIAEIGEWWGSHPQKKKEIQVDIVATDAKANNIQGRKLLIGSCKYKSEAVGTDELELLRDYASVFTKADDECFFYLFSKSGFTESLLQVAKSPHITLITLPDLYE